MTREAKHNALFVCAVVVGLAAIVLVARACVNDAQEHSDAYEREREEERADLEAEYEVMVLDSGKDGVNEALTALARDGWVFHERRYSDIILKRRKGEK